MSQYGQESLWRDTAAADAEQARDLAARLERRAKAEDEVAARETYLGLLDIATGERVLDVGCGSGAVTREIARRVGSRGLAVGVDPSPALLAVARELAQEAGFADRVEFCEGTALRLPFPDRSFDAVVCVTVLSHVPRGKAAIPELVRVLRSGGRLGVFDLDTRGLADLLSLDACISLSGAASRRDTIGHERGVSGTRCGSSSTRAPRASGIRCSTRSSTRPCAGVRCHGEHSDVR